MDALDRAIQNWGRGLVKHHLGYYPISLSVERQDNLSKNWVTAMAKLDKRQFSLAFHFHQEGDKIALLGQMITEKASPL